MLVKTGAISAIKAENKNSGFKRSRTLEGKLKVREQVLGPGRGRTLGGGALAPRGGASPGPAPHGHTSL